uniref:Uncharacterized protein n=1 Tax=Anopheles minimus TaxID=112268 RepID=A0A182WPE0_9DIPT
MFVQGFSLGSAPMNMRRICWAFNYICLKLIQLRRSVKLFKKKHLVIVQKKMWRNASDLLSQLEFWKFYMHDRS